MLSLDAENTNQSPGDIVRRNNLFGMNSPSNQYGNYDRAMVGLQTVPPKVASSAVTGQKGLN